MVGDPAILKRIRACPFTRGGRVLVCFRANGHSLFARRSGEPLARLRLTGNGAGSCCSTPHTAAAGERSATSGQAPRRSTTRFNASATIHTSWNCARPTVEPRQPIDTQSEGRSLETTVYKDRARNILEPSIPKRLIGTTNFTLHFLMESARDVHAPWLGQSLEAGGNVDALSIDVLTLDDHVSQVHAYPKLDPLRERRLVVVPGDVPLRENGGADGLDRTFEHRQKAVASRLHQTAAMRGYCWPDEVTHNFLDT